MENNHIVYAAFSKDGVCLYVGEGKKDRWKHIVSGTSHVYEANRWHFAGKKVEVTILAEGLTKLQAVTLEKEKILELNPAWNKADYGLNMIPLRIIAYATKRFKLSVKRLKGYHMGNKDRDLQVVKDLCKVLNNKGETVLTQGQRWNSIPLPNGFMSHLATEGDKYYAAIKKVFNIVKVEGTTAYKVELIGWKDELPKYDKAL